MIESDTWIGCNVTILPGVTIGQGCVIGAGSVVTTPLPPYTVCVGSPCKPIKTRFSPNELEEHLRSLKNNLRVDQVISQWKKSDLKY